MKSRLLLVCTVLAASVSLVHAEERAPLRVKLPPPIFVGTPVPIKLPNLEAKPSEPPTILVPEGTVNLALGKTFTASDEAPLLGDVSLINDEDKAGDEGCFVEFGPGKQWVQVDLGASSTIFAVWVSHFHSQARAYLDVVVQASDDPDFINGVTTLFNNDHDNTSGLGVGKDPAYIETYKGRLIPTPSTDGLKARYVRLYSAGNTSNNLNHYIEVEVFGVPAQ
ncbi:MAG: hypothetical protein SFV32_08510 [Opitutaceae bacterium]|nr:hypothetical protein [Opitutaceae bacterium]